MVRFPRGLTHTRTRINRSHLIVGNGWSLLDPGTNNLLMRLSLDISVPGDGFTVLELFKNHHVLYRIVLSEELKQSGVSLDKLVNLFISKMAVEASVNVKMTAVDTHILPEQDVTNPNIIVLWLEDTPIAEFEVLGETIDDVTITTELNGPTIHLQAMTAIKTALAIH